MRRRRDALIHEHVLRFASEERARLSQLRSDILDLYALEAHADELEAE